MRPRYHSVGRMDVQHSAIIQRNGAMRTRMGRGFRPRTSAACASVIPSFGRLKNAQCRIPTAPREELRRQIPTVAFRPTRANGGPNIT